TARSVMAHFVRSSVEGVQEVTGVVCNAYEHWDTLGDVAERSLSLRQLTPSLATIHVWLANERKIQALTELLRHSGIIRQDTAAANIEYRHDRVRDYILSFGMRRVASDTSRAQILFDPFFAEIAASALVDLGVPTGLVDAFGQCEPLVLALALAM